MINGIVRSFQNVLNQDSGGQVDVFCCILKKNKIQITLINQKLSRHQSIYWCIGVLGTAQQRKYIVFTLNACIAQNIQHTHCCTYLLLSLCFVIFVTRHLTVMTFEGPETALTTATGDSVFLAKCYFINQKIGFPYIFGWLFNNLLFAVLDRGKLHFIPHWQTPIPPQNRRCWLLIYCLLFVMFQHFTRAWLMN